MTKPWRPFRAPKCSGYGDVSSRFRHQLTCHEVACDLRYVAADYDWKKVVRSYVRRDEALDGNDRADEDNKRTLRNAERRKRYAARAR